MFDRGLWAIVIVDWCALIAGHVGIGEVRAVGDDRARQIQQAVVLEAIEQPVAVPRERVAFVDRILGRVDVHADAKPPRQIDAAGERLVIERETGMRTDQCRELAVGSLLAQPNVALVFRQPFARLPSSDCGKSLRSTSPPGNRPPRCLPQAPTRLPSIASGDA